MLPIAYLIVAIATVRQTVRGKRFLTHHQSSFFGFFDKKFRSHHTMISIVSFNMRGVIGSILLSLLFLVGTTVSLPAEDLIEELPSFGKTPTPHYSGYLDASKGCDIFTNGPICKIHYWLALAEDDPMNKPVVLWLNGGPGSSSLLGFLQEEGPLLINATGGLMVNPWSWTKLVNLVAIEAPMGVGYSVSLNQLVPFGW